MKKTVTVLSIVLDVIFEIVSVPFHLIRAIFDIASTIAK